MKTSRRYLSGVLAGCFFMWIGCGEEAGEPPGGQRTTDSSAPVGGDSGQSGQAGPEAGLQGSAGEGGSGHDDAGPEGAPGGPEGGDGEAGGPTPGAGDCAKLFGGAGPTSAWASLDAKGKLAYKTVDARGDHIVDFSHAGYGGGGVALPIVPVRITVDPPSGDATASIQTALDAVAKMPLSGGVRGAVLLKPGVYQLSDTLNMTASGVVLRGSGSGAGGTEIRMTGTPHNFVDMRGAGSWATTGTAAVISDDYVPSGARSVTVDNASSFKAGDTVLVRRPVTAGWVTFMGMDTLVRDGAPQTWLSTTTLIPADRVVTSVDANRITLDVPLTDSYDAKYTRPGATVTKYTFAGRIDQVGVEALHVVAPSQTAAITATLFTLFTVTAVQDGWVSDVSAVDTENSVTLDTTVKRFTVQDFSLERSMIADGTAGYPLEVQYLGSQILVQRAHIKGDNLYTFATNARATGPNVVLNSVATGVHTRLEPHARWATGFLADNVVHDDQLNLVNRLTAGSGHGWAIGWGVLWNSAAATLNVERPPGSMNWSIGGKGREAGDGTFDATGTPVTPKSLYLAQLCERLGPGALANIGYATLVGK